MTTQEILEKFELQVDDASELSTSEELDLANNVYGDICDDRDWEWLKKTYSGTTSTSVPYVTLPTDFKYVAPNKDNKSIVFIGTDYQEYKVIPMADRRDFRDQDGYCYVDIVNQRLVFTLQPTSAKAIEYDYIKIQPALDLLGASPTGSNPLFRAGFHQIIAFGMAARFNNIELSDKSTSYQRENQILYNEVLNNMATEDAKIKLSI